MRKEMSAEKRTFAVSVFYPGPMTIRNPSLPLFDDAPRCGNVAAFEQAFEAWLADQRGTGSLRQAGSISVYRDMWEAFAAWCLGQSPAVTLASLGLEDLQAFQAARFGRKTSDLSLTPRYALRLMRLIDRVLRHHAAQTDTVPNTAAADWISVNPEVRFADAAHSDPLPEYLSVAEARQLIAFLSAARPQPGAARASLPVWCRRIAARQPVRTAPPRGRRPTDGGDA